MKPLAVIVFSALCTNLVFAADWYSALPFMEDKEVCVVEDFSKVSGCKVGDIVSFMPSVFGNKQLPIRFITFYCKPSEPIYMNEAGVVCTYAGENVRYSGEERADWLANSDKRKEWQDFVRQVVIAENSKWVKVNQTMYKMVLTEGTGPQLQAPCTYVVSYKSTNAKGEITPEPVKEKYDEAKDSKSTFLDHHIGTVLDVLWVDEKDMAKTRRYQATIEPATGRK